MTNHPTSSVYADYNATSPLRKEAKDAMVAAMDVSGNASSVHRFGREARQQVEQARGAILDALGLPTYRVVFTSGATEALATVLSPGTQALASKRAATQLCIAPTEHVAALQGHGFAPDQTLALGVDADGLVDTVKLAELLSNLPDDTQSLVAVHGANNETGVIQPIADIAAAADVHNTLFVSDFVQWAGRLPLGDARPQAIIISSHKFGGPAGVGAILYDPTALHFSQPLLRGGGQERGVRAGTENVVGIVGMAAALQAAVAAQDAEEERLVSLRDAFEAELLSMHPAATIFGKDAPRLANTSCFALPGQDAALALMQLDLDGVALSSGSACSSGKVKQSHVLLAMGVAPELASCALRLSLGFGSTQTDIDRILASIHRWS